MRPPAEQDGAEWAGGEQERGSSHLPAGQGLLDSKIGEDDGQAENMGEHDRTSRNPSAEHFYAQESRADDRRDHVMLLGAEPQREETVGEQEVTGPRCFIVTAERREDPHDPPGLEGHGERVRANHDREDARDRGGRDEEDREQGRAERTAIATAQGCGRRQDQQRRSDRDRATRRQRCRHRFDPTAMDEPGGQGGRSIIEGRMDHDQMILAVIRAVQSRRPLLDLPGDGKGECGLEAADVLGAQGQRQQGGRGDQRGRAERAEDRRGQEESKPAPP